MASFLLIHDLPNPDDPQRRSYRECNLDRQHAIPVGALVEWVSDGDEENNGLRLFVARHDRDCDGTPLYALGLYDYRTAWDRPGRPVRRVCLVVHDEICMSVDDDPALHAKIQETFNAPRFGLRIPLRSSMKTGRNWWECK